MILGEDPPPVSRAAWAFAAAARRRHGVWGKQLHTKLVRGVPALAPLLCAWLALAGAQEPPAQDGPFPGGGAPGARPSAASAYLGSWQLALGSTGRRLDALLVVAPNGAYTYSSRQVDRGKMEARWGTYHLAPAEGQPEEGTYALLYPDQVWFSSARGTAEWRRFSRTDAPDAAVDPSLPGVWQRRESQGGVSSDLTWEIQPSGDCALTVVGEEKGTWRINQGRFLLTATGSSFTWQGSLADRQQTLVLSDGKGNEISFRRQAGSARPK